jgi:hypothetical protein
MKRRKFITLLAGAAAAWPSVARAQQDDRVRALLHRILRLQAENAAANIRQFIKEIESQVGWTKQMPWSVGSIEQRRTDSQRLLRQVPAIMEIAQLDPAGIEQLRVSRLVMTWSAASRLFLDLNSPRRGEPSPLRSGLFLCRESRELRQDEFRESDALSGPAWPSP